MSFADKVVIVTGASSGIGAKTAILFSKEGAKVTIVGRNEAKLQSVAKQCADAGKNPLAIRADVSKEEDAKRIVTETIEKYGKLDVLVNNAGIIGFGSILEGSILQSYDTIMTINVRAQIHLTQLAAPHLVETKGNIINISSVAGSSSPLSSATTIYHVSKAALNHFTRGAALELAPHGVRVNSISPGPVRTDIMQNAGLDKSMDELDIKLPLERISDPEEIADLILFLASDKARAITGSDYVSDNGYLLARS